MQAEYHLKSMLTLTLNRLREDRFPVLSLFYRLYKFHIVSISEQFVWRGRVGNIIPDYAWNRTLNLVKAYRFTS